MTRVTQVRSWPVWDFFFPPLCECCEAQLRREDVLFCAQCWANAPGVDPRDYPKLKYVDMLSAVYHFSSGNIIQAAAHALKYDGFDLVGREMARRMAQRIPKRFLAPEVHWEPVPLHWMRRMERSFNQSAILGRALARELHRETAFPVTKRIRNTPSQTAYTFRERSQNVRDAFKIVNRKELPKSILLIDDVVTTGATVNECARTLKQAGVEWVGAFAFALAGK
jgi:ComF family protein